jgi:NitT/TauT family transport system substrate-binding protein
LSHAQSSKTSHLTERIAIAHSTPFNSTPIYVALEKGYFKPEIDVSLRGSIAGKDALNDVLKERADIGTVADTPFAYAVMEGAKVSIIATISETINSMVLVGLKDRGIATPGDLRGKKIGVRIATGGDFFLDSILLFNGIAKNGVKKVDLTPDKLLSSLLKGEVDAVISWDPFTHELLDALGANGFTYYGDPAYNRYTWNLAARKDRIGKRPETVKKVLKALIQGVSFIKKNPIETRKIVAITAIFVASFETQKPTV